jgi:hypothetical protein
MSGRIPGLVSISEVQGEGGSMQLVFEIKDGAEEQFFSAFGLQSGDVDGFQRVVIESLERLLQSVGAGE